MSSFEIREIYGADVIPYKKLACVMFRYKNEQLSDEEAYGKVLAEEDAKRREGFFRPAAFYEGKLYAGLESHGFTVNFDGHPCNMSGIGGVISDPNAPFKGAMKQIYMRSFEIMREKRQYLSHLYPFSENYYRQYGYDVTCQTATWPVPVDKFIYVKEGTLKAFDGSDEMKQDIISVYEKFSKGKNLMIFRDEMGWTSFFDHNKPYVAGISSFVHYDENGTADAYMNYVPEAQADKPQNLVVKNLWYADYAGLRGILAHFAVQQPYCDRVILPLPETLDISPIIDSKGGWGKRRTNRSLNNEGTSRVVDVEEILKLAAYKGEGQVCIRIYDDIYAPWNNDCFTVTFGTETTVTRGGTPDIEMKITSFSSGILGRFDLNNLMLFPDVKVHNPEQLEKVFYKKTLWIEEHF